MSAPSACMRRNAALFAIAALMLFSAAGAGAQGMRFGVDVGGSGKAIAAGMPVTYTTIWAGAWNQRWGWDGIAAQLQTAKANGLTPVVQWWYWGDDISPTCVEQGCWDGRQGVWKDKATWYRLSNELAGLIVRTMGAGASAVVVVETEFNKSGIESYEPFDGYLADHLQLFHARGFSAVLTFGNWAPNYWPNFDRAVAAADMLGTMALESSIHEASQYPAGADLLINAARRLQSLFGKPIFVTDLGFSSYPEPSYEYAQDSVVKNIFARMGELWSAGVRGIIWRQLVDDPTMDTSNYHGMAERYWGLLRADGSRKLAFTSFLNGMRTAVIAPTPVAPAPVPVPVVVPPPRPPAPANLTAAAGNGSVTLAWTSVGPGAVYTVSGSTASGGPYRTLAILSGTSFLTGGLANGSTYYFVVTATTAAGVSAASKQASATPSAPASLSVWWPANGVTVSGVQPFKAVMDNVPLSGYKMFWQVDNGQLNAMADNLADYPHKEASVSLAGWNWRGAGPYTLNYVAQDSSGKLLAQKTITIYVR